MQVRRPDAEFAGYRKQKQVKLISRPIDIKNPTAETVGLCSRYLSSRAVARQVLSAQMSLTSVFGMGTGGPSSQSTRTIYAKAYTLTIVIMPQSTE